MFYNRPTMSHFNPMLSISASTPLSNLLTGAYNTPDGGLYYMRPIGNILYFAGFSNLGVGNAWTNSFAGTADNRGNVAGSYANLPRGTSMNDQGNITLNTSNPSSITRVAGPAASVYTKTATPPPIPQTVPAILPNQIPSSNRGKNADNLTGVWLDNLGGVNYVRLLGNNVRLLSMSNNGTGAGYTALFVGTLQGAYITGSWVDLPRGTFPLRYIPTTSFNFNLGQMVLSAPELGMVLRPATPRPEIIVPLTPPTGGPTPPVPTPPTGGPLFPPITDQPGGPFFPPITDQPGGPFFPPITAPPTGSPFLPPITIQPTQPQRACPQCPPGFRPLY